MFEWTVSFIRSTGIIGVGILMLAENVVPPIPSELIMPLAGFSAARGEMSLLGAIVAGAFGSLLGAFLWYYVGWRLGADRLKRWSARHGRWLTLTPKEIDYACAWFRRHGGKAVMLGRLVPTVRTLISVPAGIAGMGFTRFAIFSAAGSIIWTTVLASAGFLLEAQYQRISEWTGPISNLVIGGILIWYAYRVATFKVADSRPD